MEVKDFLEKNKSKKIMIEEEKGNIKKVVFEEMDYQIIEDHLYIKDKKNPNLVGINLNLVRSTNGDSKKIMIILDDKNETIINFSLI